MYRWGSSRHLDFKSTALSLFLMTALSACQIEGVITVDGPPQTPPTETVNSSGTTTSANNSDAGHSHGEMLAPPAPEQMPPPLIGSTGVASDPHAHPVSPPFDAPSPMMPPMPMPPMPMPTPIPENAFQGALSKSNLVQVQNCSDFEDQLLDKWVDAVLSQGGYCPGCMGSVHPPEVYSSPNGGFGVYSSPSPFIALPSPVPLSGGREDENRMLLSDDGGVTYGLVNGKLKVMKVLPVGQTALIANVDVGSDSRALYLDRDSQQLLVLGTRFMPPPPMPPLPGMMPFMPGDGGVITISFVDISQPEAPVVTRKLELDGQMLHSRQSGGYLYLTSYTSLGMPQSVWQDGTFNAALENYRKTKELADAYQFVLDNSENTLSEDLLAFGSGTQALVAELRAIIVAKMSASMNDSMSGVLPKLRQQLSGESGLLSCESLLMPEGSSALNQLFAVSKIRIADAATLSVGLVAPVRQLFEGNGDTLYLTVPVSSYEVVGGGREHTNLYQFDIAGEALAFRASGVVPGLINSNGAVNESNGILRVFSTEFVRDDVNHLSYQSSHLSLLSGDANANLASVAQMINFSPNQHTTKVMFGGTRAYVMTSGYTHGLYAFDFTNPLSPVKGVMQAFNYADGYWRLLNETTLFSIQQQFNTTTGSDGLELRMHDMSDLNASVAKYAYSMSSSARSHFWTPVIYDPSTVNYDAQSSTVFFPVEQESLVDRTFSRMLVGFELSQTSGIRKLGQVSHSVTPQLDIEACMPSLDGMMPPCFPPPMYASRQLQLLGSQILHDEQNSYLFSVSDLDAKLFNIDQLNVELGSIRFDDSPYLPMFPVK